jgi:hypothetical protein
MDAPGMALTAIPESISFDVDLRAVTECVEVFGGAKRRLSARCNKLACKGSARPSPAGALIGSKVE